MDQMSKTTIENLKGEAKRMKKADGITHVEALNRLAKREGFKHWGHLVAVAARATTADHEDGGTR